MATSESAGQAGVDGASSSAAPSSLVMLLIVDESLVKDKQWTLGPMMAQAAHATSAVLAQTSTHANTRAYLSPENLPHMRKVVLKVPAKTGLVALSEALKKAKLAAEDADDIDGTNKDFPSHHLWIEQPEDIPTVLAIAPNTRPAALKKVLKSCSLLRE